MRPQRAGRGDRVDPALGAGEVHVWTISLKGVRFPVDGLSPAEVARARRFRFPIDRDRFVRAHAAARAILGAYLDVGPGEVAIQVDAAGKPRLDPRRHAKGLRFNLAHSHGLAVLALSRAELGVDLELRRSLPDSDAVVRRYFSRAEAAAYFALPRRLRSGAFLAAWTLKEAYLKACGAGFRRPLDSFSVTMRPDLPPRLLTVPGRPGEAARWRLLRLTPRADYIGAVVVARRTVRLREWAWSGALQ